MDDEIVEHFDEEHLQIITARMETAVSLGVRAAGDPEWDSSQGGGGLEYAYDGPLLKSQIWSGGLVNGAVTRTTYDANFWLKAETYGGQTVNYDYDNDGLLKLAGALTINRGPTTGFVSSTVLGGVTDTSSYDPTYGELSDAQAMYQSSNLQKAS